MQLKHLTLICVAILLVLAFSTSASATPPEATANLTPEAPAQTEMQAASSPDMSQPAESVTGDLSKSAETPMKTPEGEDGLLKEFITPNIADFETARESDMLSSVSF